MVRARPPQAQSRASLGITTERLGICVRRGNTALREAIGKAQAELMADGTLAALVKEWLGGAAHLPQ